MWYKKKKQKKRKQLPSHLIEWEAHTPFVLTSGRPDKAETKRVRGLYSNWPNPRPCKMTLQNRGVVWTWSCQRLAREQNVPSFSVNFLYWMKENKLIQINAQKSVESLKSGTSMPLQHKRRMGTMCTSMWLLIWIWESLWYRTSLCMMKNKCSKGLPRGLNSSKD